MSVLVSVQIRLHRTLAGGDPVAYENNARRRRNVIFLAGLQ